MEGPNEPGRRSFLLKMAQGVGYGTFGAIAWSAYLSQTQAKTLVLRPPGALPQEQFVSTCIRCGMCVEACPYDTLSLATISDEISIGTPFYTPRKKPCYLCSDIPCANACPTNALDTTTLIKENEEVANIDNSRMGLAVINEETCLAYLGLQCTMCIRACPLADLAIVLHNQRNPRTDMHAFLMPVVVSDFCTGCGMCEHACPTENASIYVLPHTIAMKEQGSHYVVGWEAKDEERLKGVSTDVMLDRTQRNKKSALDNVNDVDGILKGIYDE